MDSRVNQGPLEVLWEELRPRVHQAMTTPVLGAQVARPATTITAPALDLTVLVVPLAAPAMTTPVAADTVTPPPEKSQGLCE